MAKFRLQIIAMLVLAWGLLNIWDGIAKMDHLNFLKGVLCTSIGIYLLYFSDQIVIYRI